MASGNGKTKILFICLGNICRSPMAEAVLSHLANQRGTAENYVIRSAAIGSWHVGGKGDKRMLMLLKRNNIPFEHIVKQVNENDFNNFDYIIGMDEQNIKDLNHLAPENSRAKVELFGQYDPEKELIIRDPYYDTDLAGFEKCYEQCVRCGNGFLNMLEGK